MLSPLFSILAALVDTADAKASLSELRQRLGVLPAPSTGLLPSRLAGLSAQYGQPVVDAIARRIRRAGLDPLNDADLARLRPVLPFLARTLARPQDPSGAVFGPEVDVDLLDLAAASEGQDLLASPSWLEVLRQLHRDQAAALRHLDSLVVEQQFTPNPNGDPVEARVFAWLRRLSLRHALPSPAPNIEWITDWVRGAALPPGALEVYGPEGAIAASAAWHHEPATDLEAWTGWRSRVEAARARGWRPSPGVPVRRWDNGWSLQSLSATQLKDESAIMGHCVGDANQNYAREVTKKNAEIWSLRDPDGYPVATMEIRRDPDGGDVTMRGGAARITGVPQVRGPQNRTMHPSHRRYLWDTFRDHLDLLPHEVQRQILGQFLHRGTEDFHRLILGSPSRALDWAVAVDKVSLPDTREAALQDPDTAVRWMELLDAYQPAADTLAAAQKSPKALERYLDIAKKSEASPGLKLLIDSVSGASEAIRLREKIRSPSARHPLDERFADDPRYLSRIYGFEPVLSPETWLRLGLAPRHLQAATPQDVEAAKDAKLELVKSITLRDPYAALMASINGRDRIAADTPERQAAVLGDALAAGAYLNLHHPYRDEARPFWDAILHAPIGPLPDAMFYTSLKEQAGGFNSGELAGTFTPKFPTTRAEAALSAVVHARGAATPREQVQPLLDLVLTLRPDQSPDGQALLYLLWPDLLNDPTHLARLRTAPVMLGLANIFNSRRDTKAAPELTRWFRPGGPLRTPALKIATEDAANPATVDAKAKLLRFLALQVDQALRPDVVRAFFRLGADAVLAEIVPQVLDGVLGLSPTQRRTVAARLPHPHQWPGYAWAGNVPSSGKGRNQTIGQDVAHTWQTRWIEAQVADRIAQLRRKVRSRPLAERRTVEEGIAGASSDFKVGQSQSHAVAWGYKDTPAPVGDPSSGSGLTRLRGLLQTYKIDDLQSVDGALETRSSYRNEGFPAWPHAEAMSGGPLPPILYLGLLGSGATAYANYEAPKLSERTIYNPAAFGDAPYSLRGGLSLESPELAQWMEGLSRLDPKAQKSFGDWSGLVQVKGLPNVLQDLRVLFLAASPQDAEIAADAAVVIPIQTSELPLLGWIPWTTPTGAAGWMLLFAPFRTPGQIPFAARLGAMTRTAPRPDPV